MAYTKHNFVDGEILNAKSLNEIDDELVVLEKDLVTANTNINKKINTSDIVDNVTSSNTNKPLSANQGKILNDKALALQNKTRINYLRPTLKTQIANGVTITNNGDGTYTLNGTNNSGRDISFAFTGWLENKYGGYKLVGSPKDSSENIYRLTCTYLTSSGSWEGAVVDLGNGVILDGNHETIQISFVVKSGVTLNNIVVKPMITDDLSATYEDFISYYDCLTPDIKVDLLWENASPTSAFWAQTISLDLSKYQRCYLIVKGWMDINYYNSVIIEKGFNTYVLAEYFENGRFTTDQLNRRLFFFDDNGFTISSAIAITNNDTGGCGCIPYRIYGVR